MSTFYAEDLAYIHHTGFGGFATSAAPGLLGLLRHAHIHHGLVVDLGCGSGIWAGALVEAGYQVLGVDCSPEMIRLARTVAPEARFVETSVHSFELPPCVAVTAIGEGLTYWSVEDPRDALPALFARVSDALAPGGLLIFDAVIRSHENPLHYESGREGVDWYVAIDVREDPDRSLLTRRITTVRQLGSSKRRSEEIHELRTFSRGELEQMLRKCGLSVRTSHRYGAMSLPEHRLAFRARKRIR